MRILIFRHGPAGRRDASRWPDDGQRPLSEKGAERTEQAARGLARLHGPVSRILTSPLKRAAETARIVHEAFDLDRPVEVLDALAPGGSYRAAVQHLSTLKDDEVVIVVGHEPDLGKLAGVLLFGAPAPSLPLKKAGACAIEIESPAKAGHGHLLGFYSPRVLRRLASKGSRV